MKKRNSVDVFCAWWGRGPSPSRPATASAAWACVCARVCTCVHVYVLCIAEERRKKDSGATTNAINQLSDCSALPVTVVDCLRSTTPLDPNTRLRTNTHTTHTQHTH
jgi:hypothetical protein